MKKKYIYCDQCAEFKLYQAEGQKGSGESFQWTNLLLLDIVKYVVIIKSGAAQKNREKQNKQGAQGRGNQHSLTALHLTNT